uniref:Uncharacterized protein n=1 Tax=Oryza meridionalis TaxID=40149 RepID=A0A0E0D2L2_9ORYZ
MASSTRASSTRAIIDEVNDSNSQRRGTRGRSRGGGASEGHEKPPQSTQGTGQRPPDRRQRRGRGRWPDLSSNPRRQQAAGIEEEEGPESWRKGAATVERGRGKKTREDAPAYPTRARETEVSNARDGGKVGCSTRWMWWLRMSAEMEVAARRCTAR